MTGRRAKLRLLLGSLVASGIVFTAWTQQWFSVELPGTATITADGSVAAPALTTLALAQVALVGALAIAGPLFRFVLGAIQFLLAATVVLEAAVALGSPLAASESAIATATGEAGARHPDAVVAMTAWPVVALVGGVLLALLAIAVLVTARTWPGSSRKYSAVRVEPVDGPRSSIDDWDALSRGDDPTD